MKAVSRVFSSVLVLLVVSALLFAMCRATPVSPARLTLGGDASVEQIAEFNHQYGLDRSVGAQYGAWLNGALALDFGKSYVTGNPIGPQIADTLPNMLAYISAGNQSKKTSYRRCRDFNRRCSIQRKG